MIGLLGDVRLKAAARAVSRLDAALSCHPPLPVRTFWGQLDTAYRHAEVDGRRVDLHRLAVFPHGLPLRVGATLSLAERGGDIAALAVELRSWMVQPDPGQQDPLDRITASPWGCRHCRGWPRGLISASSPAICQPARARSAGRLVIGRSRVR